jgi:hypothetical protein
MAARIPSMKGRGGALAVEHAYVSDKLGECEMDQAVKLAHAVAEVLDEALVVMDELAEVVKGAVPRRGAGRFWAPKRAMPRVSTRSVFHDYEDVRRRTQETEEALIPDGILQTSSA